jgi:hypothetical protein
LQIGADVQHEVAVLGADREAVGVIGRRGARVLAVRGGFAGLDFLLQLLDLLLQLLNLLFGGLLGLILRPSW